MMNPSPDHVYMMQGDPRSYLRSGNEAKEPASMSPDNSPILITGWTTSPVNPFYWNGAPFINHHIPTPYYPPRKTRRRLSSSEAKVLNEAFESHPHPSAELRAKLERELGMSRRAIQIWFQNKRAKSRKIEKDGRGGGVYGEDLLLTFSPTAPAITQTGKRDNINHYSTKSVVSMAQPQLPLGHHVLQVSNLPVEGLEFSPSIIAEDSFLASLCEPGDPLTLYLA